MSVEPTARKPRRKLLLRAAVLGLAAAIGAWFLVTPLLGKILLPAAAHRILHADLGSTGLDLYPALTADSVQFADPKTPNAPVLTLSQLDVPWRWPAREGRYFERLSASSVSIDIQAAEDPGSNLGFVIDLLNAPASGIDPLPYIPRSIDLGNIKAGVFLQDWHTRLQGLALQGTVDALDQVQLNLYANSAAIEWRNPFLNTVESTPFELGRATLTGAPTGYQAQLELHAPDLADLAVNADLPSGGAVKVQIPDATLYPAYWRGLVAGLTGLDLQFDPIQIEDAAFDGTRNNLGWQGWMAQATLRTPVFKLIVPNIALYEGPLDIRMNGEQAEALRTGVVARFGEGQTLTVDAEGMSPVAWKAQTEAIPMAWFTPVAERVNNAVLTQFVQESHLALTGDGTWTPEALTGAAKLNFTQSGRALTPLALSFDRGAEQINVAVEAKQDNALLRLALHQQTGVGMQLEASAASLPLGAWWPQHLPLGLDGVITAKVTADFTDLAAIPWNMELQSDRITNSMPGWPETLPVQAKLSGTVASLGLLQFSGEAALSEGNTIKIEDASYTGGALHAKVETALHLEDWAVLAGAPDLFGDVILNGTLTASADQVSGTITASTERLGQGDVSLPYRSTATLKSGLLWSSVTRVNAMNDLQVTLDPETSFVCAALEITPQEAGNAFELRETRIESALTLLAKFGYAESAEGTLSADLPNVQFADGRLTLEAKSIALNAATLFLADGGPRFFQLAVVGAGNSAPGQQIAGTITAEHLETGGAKLSGLGGEWTFGEGGLQFSPLKGALFNGAVDATVDLQPLLEGLPITFKATFENLDLAAFSTEMKPPDTNLTGLVRGTVSLAVAAGQLTHFEAHLEANEGVTINRDMVESILLSQQFGGVTGAAVTRTLRKILGDAPQRPFDSVAMDLTLQDGRITGDAKLESESLGLTVDIKADPKAILEALRARQ